MTFPAPRTVSLTDAPVLRWGILGPGRISDWFVRSMQQHTTQQVVAVGSRSALRSTEFAARFGIPHAHATYEDLVADPDVDVIYIGTPNGAHHGNALLALRAGKHVLVEKSFALNAVEARELIEEAEERGLFIMEGMWTRFLPFMDSVRQVLETDGIGEPIGLTADLGDFDAYDPDAPAFSRELGGGVTLDRGVYVTALSSFLLGTAETVHAVGHRAPTGVDTHLAITLGNGKGAHAQLLASMLVKTPSHAVLIGTKGSIEFESPWYLAPTVTWRDSAGEVVDVISSDLRTHIDALCFEAVEVARVIASGGTSSALMPARETLQISETLDEILRTARADWDDADAYLSTSVTSNE